MNAINLSNVQNIFDLFSVQEYQKNMEVAMGNYQVL